MTDETAGQLDDPPARPVSVTWVWPDRYLLTIGDSMSVVLTGAEVAALADEVNREMGRDGV